MNSNFNKICRLCLRICEEYVDLNQANGVKTLADDLIEKIKYCYVVQIDISEELPTKICYECIQVLSFFYTAKKNVLISEQLLKDVVFVRKKLQEETKNYGEMITPDTTKNKQKKAKMNPVVVIPRISELEKSDQNGVTVIDVELNYSEQCVKNSCNSTTPLVDVETGKIISEIDKNDISFLEGHNSRLGEKKSLEPKADGNYDIRKLPNTNNDLDILLNMRDLRRNQHKQGRKQRKDESAKMSLRINPPSKENVKGIRTKIDTRSILSPYMKNSRKM